MIEIRKVAVAGPNGYQVWNNDFGDVFCISDAGDRGELWVSLTCFRELAAHIEAVAAEYEESLNHWNLWSEWTLATSTGPWAA